MKSRVWLQIAMPLIFLISVYVIYWMTGVAALLYINYAVLAIIFVSVSILCMLRRDHASCFGLDNDQVHIGRQWPFADINKPLQELRFRQLGAQLYRIELQGHSLLFDKSKCSCMTDDEFDKLIRSVS